MKDAVSRRRFVQYLAMLGVGGRTFWGSGNARAAVAAAREAGDVGSWPDMAHRELGRTGFRASRLFMGCGASLMLFEKDELLDTAYDAGINVFDVGFRGYYQYAERNLAGFLKRRRDDVFLISKGIADSAVPMSLLADHPNVQFNYYRGGIGTCEVEMH
jgi:hypothetical protein